MYAGACMCEVFVYVCRGQRSISAAIMCMVLWSQKRALDP